MVAKYNNLFKNAHLRIPSYTYIGDFVSKHTSPSCIVLGNEKYILSIPNLNAYIMQKLRVY